MFSFIKDNLFLCFVIFLLVVAPSFLFGAIQIFAVIIIAIFVLAVVGIAILRWKLRKFANQQTTTNREYTSSQQNKKGEPDVKIYTSNTEKKVAKDVGDYVDFEEIKDGNN